MNDTCIDFQGYFPGLIGQVTRLHAVFYNENWGFDSSFETQVARELAEFVERFDPGRDAMLAATVNGELAGFIAVDGRPAEGARTRWFIVKPGLQGQGLGKALMTRALEFCRKAGHGRVFLWTFKGLDAARKVYENAGFVLTEERKGAPWGPSIMEQKFELDPRAA